MARGLRITLHGGSGLPSSRLFTRISINNGHPTRFITHTTRGPNPGWNCVATFEPHFPENADVVFEIWRISKYFGEKMIGKVELNLQQYLSEEANPNRVSHNVCLPNGDFMGSIEISYTLNDVDVPPVAAANVPNGRPRRSRLASLFSAFASCIAAVGVVEGMIAEEQ